MKINFKNFGAIKEAEIEVKPLTIISGKNETGKSFILKFIYSLPFVFSSHFFDEENKRIVVSIKSFANFDKKNKTVNELSQEEILEKKLKDIFQISSIKELININSKSSIINIETSLEIPKGGNENEIFTEKQTFNGKILLKENKVSLEGSIILNLPDQNTNFIPTPLILDLEKGIALYKEQFKENLGISDIYWDVISKIRNVGKAKDVKLKRIYNKIQKLLNGRFKYQIGEGFILKRGRKKFKVDLLASGIKTLGIIQMLIERNLLEPYSILLIEEPEVHLHPSLRFKLVEILAQLSKEKVFVVFSTHSPEILKYVEYLINKGKIKLENSSFLHLEMEKDGSIGKSLSDLEVLNTAIMSLTEEMFDLMIKEELED